MKIRLTSTPTELEWAGCKVLLALVLFEFNNLVYFSWEGRVDLVIEWHQIYSKKYVYFVILMQGMFCCRYLLKTPYNHWLINALLFLLLFSKITLFFAKLILSVNFCRLSLTMILFKTWHFLLSLKSMSWPTHLCLFN